MTGFKSGSAGDPFSSGADDDSGGGDAGNDESATAETSGSMSTTETDRGSEVSVDRDQQRDDDGDTTSTSTSSGTGLPWIYERNSITDGRAQTVQLHLQQSTLDRQREGKRDIEALLGESIKKADLREAALLVGLEHLDEIADQLREWGYDFE
ncbi:hypothetical protein [Natrinema longum]|uniref:hypothetical protein n=1 Tax=Natrinema longum TaxID=370324 RepID=UPI001CCD5693|nr:hypothetical protein [Natrinema longum]MBZ6496945.1 hypothetical protein [Natrinema longum]